MIPYVFSVINFVLFLIVLWALLRKPVQIFFSTRREKFKATVAAAEKRRQASEAQLQESEAQYPYFKEEAERLAASMMRQGEEETKAIIGAAQERAERMVLDARRLVALEMARMQQNLYAEAMDKAFDRAAKEIGESMDPTRAKLLAQRSVEVLAKSL